jgi:hypothetical protein
VNALAYQICTQPIGERIIADPPDHRDITSCPRRRDGLVRTLAAANLDMRFGDTCLTWPW